MVYKYFDHQADVGIIGEGSSNAVAFQEAAKAMFNVMYDADKARALQTITIKARAEKIDELFVEWLNKLLAQADLKRLVFSQFKVQIEQKTGYLALTGIAKGEFYNEKKHGSKTEVKAATYSQLKVGKKGDRWFAQTVVDV